MVEENSENFIGRRVAEAYFRFWKIEGFDRLFCKNLSRVKIS